MKRNLLILGCLLFALTGCNGGGKTGGDVPSEDSAKTETVNTDDGKHTVKYITQRLNTIYELQDDKKCCSERYLKLYNEAVAVSKRSGMTFIDSDHWVQGNDIDPDWAYSILEVTDITPTTANARVLVCNYTERDVILKLVFEHGDWYVDNFLTEAGGGWGGPDAEPDIFDEVEDMKEFIKMVKGDIEIAQKIVGMWGWVGDHCPELLLTFEQNGKGQVKVTDCTIYRIYSFHGPLCGVYDGKVQISQMPDNSKIDLSLTLNEKGDELSGHIELKLEDGYHYDGNITLKKDYFKYGDED